MKIINIIISLFFISTNLIYAQEIPSPEELAREDERIRKEMEDMQKQELETLKEIDPQAYERRLKGIERGKKINEIVSLYNHKEITESAARSKLQPLVEEEVSEYLESFDSQIERLEKRLDYLKRIKNNPSELIEKKMDRYLGKTGPEFEEEPIW